MYFPFLQPRSLLFNERIRYCITFSQLESRWINCNHFCQPYKTEGYNCKNQVALVAVVVVVVVEVVAVVVVIYF